MNMLLSRRTLEGLSDDEEEVELRRLEARLG